MPEIPGQISAFPDLKPDVPQRRPKGARLDLQGMRRDVVRTLALKSMTTTELAKALDLSPERILLLVRALRNDGWVRCIAQHVNANKTKTPVWGLTRSHIEIEDVH